MFYVDCCRFKVENFVRSSSQLFIFLNSSVGKTRGSPLRKFCNQGAHCVLVVGSIFSYKIKLIFDNSFIWSNIGVEYDIFCWKFFPDTNFNI